MHPISMQPLQTTSSSIPNLPERPETQFYTWRGYHCAYEFYKSHQIETKATPPLVLLHPIGVGLSRKFWHRFCQAWSDTGETNSIYNPDLLGCGESAMPHVAYHSQDWAEQLQCFLQTVVKQPVVLLVHGASLPIAIELMQLQTEPHLIQALVLSGPPTWRLIAQDIPSWQHRTRWNIFDSPIGNLFYRYARRPQFLRSFSTKRLFAEGAAVDSSWLDTLLLGAEDLASRHAVFSFLAGFWQQDYRARLAAISQPVLIVMGEQASSIGRRGKAETPEQRMAEYLKCLPNVQGVTIPGRNVLPYESTQAFIEATSPWIAARTLSS